MPGQRGDWWAKCGASLVGHPINLVELPGIPGDYVTARCRGFVVGDAPFVSYVDPDDLVMPGAFEACLRALDDPALVMVWTNSLAVHEDSPMSSARLVTPATPHQLIVIRRWAAETALRRGPIGDIQFRSEVGKLGEARRIDFVGYVWRTHRMTQMQKDMRCAAGRWRSLE
jgi:hypothetical protein